MAIPITSYTVTPQEITIHVDQVAELVFAVTPSDARNVTQVGYESPTDGSEDMTVVHVMSALRNPDNSITATLRGLKIGDVYIVGTNQDDDGTIYTAKTLVHVVATPVTGVNLDRNSLLIHSGQHIQLTATITPADATDKKVSWWSSNVNVVQVDTGGMVVGVEPGVADVTVTTEDGGHTSVCTCTVPQPVTGISLDKSQLDVSLGRTQLLTASVLPDTAYNKTVYWTSSDESVATVSNGVVTGISRGTAVITARTEEGNYQAECQVTVRQMVESITMDETAYVTIGKQLQLNAIITPIDADNKNVSWVSDNEALVTVDNTGLVSGIEFGEATITVTTEDGNHKAYCSVEVILRPPMSLHGQAQGTDAILWTWDFASDADGFYIFDENGKFIDVIPVDDRHYLEKGLVSSTLYTRTLASYVAIGVDIAIGEMSEAATCYTEAIIPEADELKGKNQHRTFRRPSKRLKAFKSGIGDHLDCKVADPATQYKGEDFKLKCRSTGYKKYPYIAYPARDCDLRFVCKGYRNVVVDEFENLPPQPYKFRVRAFPESWGDLYVRSFADLPYGIEYQVTEELDVLITPEDLVDTSYQGGGIPTGWIPPDPDDGGGGIPGEDGGKYCIPVDYTVTTYGEGPESNPNTTLPVTTTIQTLVDEYQDISNNEGGCYGIPNNFSVGLDIDLLSAVDKASPVDLVFVIDFTGSMTPYIENYMKHLEDFFNDVMKDFDKMRVGFVGFSDGLGGVMKFTYNGEEWVNNYTDALDFITQFPQSYGDGEYGCDAISYACKEYSWRADATHNICIFTDAKDQEYEDGDLVVFSQTEADLKQIKAKLHGASKDDCNPYVDMVNNTEGYFSTIDFEGDMQFFDYLAGKIVGWKRELFVFSGYIKMPLGAEPMDIMVDGRPAVLEDICHKAVVDGVLPIQFDHLDDWVKVHNMYSYPVDEEGNQFLRFKVNGTLVTETDNGDGVYDTDTITLAGYRVPVYSEPATVTFKFDYRNITITNPVPGQPYEFRLADNGLKYLADYLGSTVDPAYLDALLANLQFADDPNFRLELRPDGSLWAIRVVQPLVPVVHTTTNTIHICSSATPEQDKPISDLPVSEQVTLPTALTPHYYEIESHMPGVVLYIGLDGKIHYFLTYDTTGYNNQLIHPPQDFDLTMTVTGTKNGQPFTKTITRAMAISYGKSYQLTPGPLADMFAYDLPIENAVYTCSTDNEHITLSYPEDGSAPLFAVTDLNNTINLNRHITLKSPRFSYFGLTEAATPSAPAAVSNIIVQQMFADQIHNLHLNGTITVASVSVEVWGDAVAVPIGPYDYVKVYATRPTHYIGQTHREIKVTKAEDLVYILNVQDDMYPIMVNRWNEAYTGPIEKVTSDFSLFNNDTFLHVCWDKTSKAQTTGQDTLRMYSTASDLEGFLQGFVEVGQPLFFSDTDLKSAAGIVSNFAHYKFLIELVEVGKAVEAYWAEGYGVILNNTTRAPILGRENDILHIRIGSYTEKKFVTVYSNWMSTTINGPQTVGGISVRHNAEVICPINPGDIIDPVYSVEFGGGAGGVYYWFEEGQGITTTFDHDTVILSLNHSEIYYKKQAVGMVNWSSVQEYHLKDKKPVDLIIPMPNPALNFAEDIKDINYYVSTDNANVEIQLMISIKDLVHQANGAEIIDVPVRAWILVPNLGNCSVHVHNGYYYLNSDEYYLHVTSKLKSIPEQFVEELNEKTFPYIVKAICEVETQEKPMEVSDPTAQNIWVGTLVDGMVIDDNNCLTLRLDPVTGKYEQGSYISDKKMLEDTPDVMLKPVFEADIPGDTWLDYFLLIEGGPGEWEHWDLEADEQGPKAGQVYQYRIEAHGGNIYITEPTTVVWTSQEDFEKCTVSAYGDITTYPGSVTIAKPEMEGRASMKITSNIIHLDDYKLRDDNSVSIDYGLPIDGKDADVILRFAFLDDAEGDWETAWAFVPNQNNRLSKSTGYFKWQVELRRSPSRKAPVLSQVSLNLDTQSGTPAAPIIKGVITGGKVDAKLVELDYKIFMDGQILCDARPHIVNNRSPRDLAKEYFRLCSMDLSEINVKRLEVTTKDEDVTLVYESNPQAINGLKNIIGYTRKKDTRPVSSESKFVMNEKKLVLSPIPQQGSAVVVHDQNGKMLTPVHFVGENGIPTLTNTEYLTGNGTNRLDLSCLDIDFRTLKVEVDYNGLGTYQDVPLEEIEYQDQIIWLPGNVAIKGTAIVQYKLKDSFSYWLNYVLDSMTMEVHNDLPDNQTVYVYYEADKETSYREFPELNLNPMHAIDDARFIYITDEQLRPDSMELYINPNTFFKGINDQASLFVIVRDKYGNALPDQEIEITVSENGGLVIPGQIMSSQSCLGASRYFAPDIDGEDEATIVATCGKLTVEKKIRLIAAAQRTQFSLYADRMNIYPNGDPANLEVCLIDENFKGKQETEIVINTEWGYIMDPVTGATGAEVPVIIDSKGRHVVYLYPDKVAPSANSFTVTATLNQGSAGEAIRTVRMEVGA